MWKKRILALLLCLCMVIPSELATVFAEGETAEGTETSGSEETIPECVCESDNEDLTSHSDTECTLKAYCIKVAAEKTASEIYADWDKYPENARSFILTYMSWNSQYADKLSELNALISNGESMEEPELPESPFDEDIPSLYDVVDGQAIVVYSEAFPESAALSLKAADASTQLKNFGVSEDNISAYNIAFSYDIKILQADSSEWQPEESEVAVQIPVNAAAGTSIGILHTHEGKTTYMTTTTVQKDGTIVFFTDGFSEFVGFTVDFHYNGVDFSIPGESSILLSDLFEQLGITKDATTASSVVFSDTSLVTVERQDDGDWLLTSLLAFDTNETLVITFEDGDVVVVEVTDVTYNDKIWDLGNGYIAYVYYSVDWSTVTNRTDFYLYTGNDYPVTHANSNRTSTGQGRVPVSASGDSKLYITDRGNYWFFGSADNCNISVDDDYNFVVHANKSSGDVVYIDRINRTLMQEAGKATISQKRYSAVGSSNVEQRTVIFRVNGKDDTTVIKYFPISSGKAASQLDVQYIPSSKYYYGNSSTECGKDSNGNYEDTSGAYYSYSNGTYIVPVFTRYTVIFNGNGGTNSSGATSYNQGFVWGTAQNLTANQFTRVHTVTYNANGGSCTTTSANATATFNGWATSETGSKVYDNQYQVPAGTGLSSTAGGTVNFYADWIPASVTLPTPAKTGYKFGGWYTDATLTTKAGDAGDSYTPEANITLYAKWTANTYTATFEANGGTVSPTSSTFKITDSLSLPTPIRTGYSFAGWKVTTAAGNWANEIIYTGTSIAAGQYGNVTFTAQWTLDSYTISYNLDGGSVSLANPTSYTIDTATFTLNNPTKTGYTFSGWTGTGLTEANETVEIAKGSTGERNYTANWTPINYTITYDSNGGSTVSSQDYTITTNITLFSAPTKAGYTFNGWKPESSSGSWTASSYTADANIGTGQYGNVTLVAQWQINTYTVSASIDHGKINGAEGSYEEKVNYKNNSTPVIFVAADGYKIASITKNGEPVTFTEGITTYTFKSQEITANVVYKVTTTEIIYNITYDLNDGVVEGSNPATYKVTDSAITLINPTRQDYDFLGWTGSNGDDPQVTMTIPTGSTGDKAYTANWKKSTAAYTIEYHLQNVDGTGYTVEQVIDDKVGVIGQKPEIGEKLQFTGFTYDKCVILPASADDKILSDGTTRVVHYYNRNSYEITYELKYPDKTITTVETLKYGEDIDPSTDVPQYYSEKSEWTVTNPTSGYFAVPATMPAENVTITKELEFDGGSLTITKSGMEAGKNTVFTISGGSLAKSISVTIEGSGSVTVNYLPTGTYTVKEESWSWEYNCVGESPSDGAVDGKITLEISKGNNAAITFINQKKTTLHWLGGEFRKNNKFGRRLDSDTN